MAPLLFLLYLQQIDYIAGSTDKVEQLIGDRDRKTGEATGNLTQTRYGIFGTDLGYSFEHEGKLIIMFGDTLAKVKGGGGDLIGYSTSTDPMEGFKLDFFTDRKGDYIRVAPDGISMKGFEVPVSGVSANGKIYIVCKTNHTKGDFTDKSVLTIFDEEKKTFEVVREISELPDGKFIKMSMHHEPYNIPELPKDSDYIILWGTGKYRKSNPYLAVVPATDIESGKQVRYFAGIGDNKLPVWSDKEADAAPLFEHPVMGDISVKWCHQLKLWLMTYDSRGTVRGVLFRYSRTPWGPWSDYQQIFDPKRDGAYGQFIHNVKECSHDEDCIAGPMIGKGKDDPRKFNGGAYAPYVIERFTKVSEDTLTIYYVLSTWNPYVVVLMRSRFQITTE